MNEKDKQTESNTKPQKRKKGWKFWEDGFSIDESRVSALIVVLMILVIFIIIMTTLNIPIPDVPVGFKDIITTLIWAICGVNVFNKVSNFFNPYGNVMNGYNNSYNNGYNYNSYNNGYNYNNNGYNYNNYNSTTYSDPTITSTINPNTTSTSSLGRDGV